LSAEAVIQPLVATCSWRDFVQLTKPRITLMVGVTTAVGFLLASQDGISWLVLLHTVLGTAFLGSGASTLNQVLEVDADARMRRTANRPLPAGRMETEMALAFGAAISITGKLYLALAVNLLTAALGALTLAGYVFVYTPMKRKSTLATLVGALPGALPPMMGYTAAAGKIDAVAWMLFGILFLWQIPHFLAIAWMYRVDYERGGLRMLTEGDETGERTSRQMILYAAALVPVSLLPSILGVAGGLYFTGAILLNAGFVASTVVFGRNHTAHSARRVLLVSVVYLPMMLILMVADQVGG
jgi:protoheme IX farnesyltransferase